MVKCENCNIDVRFTTEAYDWEKQIWVFACQDCIEDIEFDIDANVQKCDICEEPSSHVENVFDDKHPMLVCEDCLNTVKKNIYKKYK